jgi:regulator of sigma E protease
MDALIMAGQIIFALAILVSLHELGHFAAARMFGIKVEKFYLFFDAWGYKLFSFKYGDTEYGIGWLPLGGYVKIAGMIDESLDTEQLNKPAEPWEFRSKPAWQRLIVMIGGVTVNFILGFLIFILSTWHYGEERVPMSALKYGIHAQEVGQNIGLKDGDVIVGVNGIEAKYTDEIKKASVFLNTGNYYDVMRNGEMTKLVLPDDIIDQISDKKNAMFDIRMPCEIREIEKGSPAEKAGLQAKDVLISLNDTATDWYHQFKERIVNYAGKTISVGVKRGNDTLTKKVNVRKNATLGFQNDYYFESSIDTFQYNLAQAIPVGTSKAYEALSDNVTGMKKLVSGKIDPRKSVQGPIGIATMFGFNWFIVFDSCYHEFIAYSSIGWRSCGILVN